MSNNRDEKDPAPPALESRPPVSQSGDLAPQSTLPVRNEARGRARRLLVIIDEKLMSHDLPESGDLSIGRSSTAAIRIDDPSISRRHAVLHIGDQLELTDAGSSNGTRIRSRKLESGQRVSIIPGEPFELGTALLMVQGAFGASMPGARAVGSSGVIVQDSAMAGLHQLAERIAKSPINVLLLGETGVGKEVMARRIHDTSPRATKPFLGLNCGALPEQLLESEMFGHERGAFTGAVQTKLGLLEAADGGTIFLDEVGDLPMTMQVKLLRVLEERQFRRVGGVETKAVDVRFVAATNRDLEEGVQAGGFRADLYYRLNGIALVIPPLRERTDEIEGLAEKFIGEASERMERTPPTLSADALEWLRTYPWPGNIRELRNAMERAALLCSGDSIGLEHLPDRRGSSSPLGTAAGGTIGGAKGEDSERERILNALAECGGNQTRAAKQLGISRNTLLARLDAYGIPRPRKNVS